MAKNFLLRLFLCAMMAVLGHGNEEVWSHECIDGAFITWTTLTALCTTPPMGPPWICSELNLNNCFGYSKASGIYSQNNGNFGNHCSACTLQLDGHTMACYCNNNDGANSVKVTVDTNSAIYTWQGYLGCFRHIAPKCAAQNEAGAALNMTASAYALRNMTLPFTA